MESDFKDQSSVERRNKLKPIDIIKMCGVKEKPTAAYKSNLEAITPTSVIKS